jgi:hypothetical protein
LARQGLTAHATAWYYYINIDIDRRLLLASSASSSEGESSTTGAAWATHRWSDGFPPPLAPTQGARAQRLTASSGKQRLGQVLNLLSA